MNVYITISTVPPSFRQKGWALCGLAEQGTPEQLRLLADRLVEAWIESPKGETE